jgi:hypothetical protein
MDNKKPARAKTTPASNDGSFATKTQTAADVSLPSDSLAPERDRSSGHYVPTTDDIRDKFSTDFYASSSEWVRSLEEEFDRWLTAHDAEVKTEAWDEGLKHAFYDASFTFSGLLEQNPYRAETQ